MKYIPNNEILSLPQSIVLVLENIRQQKSFDAEKYITAKCLLINQYFEESGLDTAVVAVSGGVDSSVVFSLLKLAKEHPESKIKNVIGITLPAFNCQGVTNQTGATEKAALMNCQELSINSLVEPLEHLLNKFTDKKLSPWAQGQAVPYLRTSLLYSLTAALTDLGYKSIIVGTTNRDEGSYLGYIGKASDALTDLQVISDLHKSEVFLVAESLGVHRVITESVPCGDMFDGRSDEEVFGAPYDFVEIYTNLLQKYQQEYLNIDMVEELMYLPPEDLSIFKKFAENVENLHKYNRHKYLSASSAIHLDITPFRFPGGWRNNTTWEVSQKIKVDSLKFVNEVKFKNPCVGVLDSTIEILSSKIIKVNNLLSQQEISDLNDLIESKDAPWCRADKYGKICQSADIGSFRKSWYSEEFSEILKKRLSNLPLKTYIPNKNNSADDEINSLVWTFNNVGSLYRFIKYQQGDALVPHYDESFKEGSHSQSLFSLVIYLTPGETHFFEDIRVVKTYDDFDSLSSEIGLVPFLKAKCNPGDALIFQHRLLHDCPIVKSEKKIIRTDLFFQKPNLGGALNGY